jgi:transcriptional regulator with XRE-family HTH domain/mannose-6-phosphate isomerase-like protein (cupin superfamily)
MPQINLQHTRAIGEKLRLARQKRQMSLRELADKAEMSASMLSQVETGKAYPSVRSIYSIAAALALPVDYFFPDPGSNNTVPAETDSNAAREMTASELRDAKVNRAADSPAVEFAPSVQSPAPVVHATGRPTIELKGGVTWSRLTALAESGAEYLEITYAPGATSGANMSHHEGREFGLVLEGELLVELAFEHYTLKADDSIIFDSATPHRLTNSGSIPMRALWVVLNRT